MHNLKATKGTFKGLIGECMFKITKDRLILTRFFSKYKYFNIFGKYLNKEQMNFLNDNWYSLDCIEMIEGKFYIYEVKTQSYLQFRPPNWKPKITKSTLALYRKAKDIGFITKSAIIVFHENWNFDTKIEDFHADNFCMDNPKTYDKKNKG